MLIFLNIKAITFYYRIGRKVCEDFHNLIWRRQQQNFRLSAAPDIIERGNFFRFQQFLLIAEKCSEEHRGGKEVVVPQPAEITTADLCPNPKSVCPFGGHVISFSTTPA